MRKKMTVTQVSFPDLKEQLRELALTDMDKFLKLTGIDTTQVFICVEKKKGKSLQQIANRVKLSKNAVRNRCKKCEGEILENKK